MSHMKRLLAPKFWRVSKKENKFIVSPSPGPHPKKTCIPLKVLLRDILNYAENSLEVKKILNEGKVLVDKKPRKDPKFPTGLMDIVEIPETNQYFRVSVNKHGLCLEEIDKSKANAKLCKITGKTIVNGGVTQLNLHDGRNVLVEKDVYKVGDSVLIGLPDQKIIKHFKFEPGADALIVSGRNKGLKGKVKEIKKRKTMLERGVVKIDVKGKEIETAKKYIIVGNPDLKGEAK
ncbi:MAG: 30S ribosomal protein S4e [Candidatus Aenigmatarchaeota archaeon]|nr:MAG: 30S ribosomal protein S4e [Candidatus Aenigmarchaeota archaeon]